MQISTRQRGAPLDLIVAEAMILANSTWGSWLGELGVPGIYRSQASLAPGVKVRMGTKALPHAGIGVKSYAWSTSPLRRYTDLVNQWQIIAAARHGRPPRWPRRSSPRTPSCSRSSRASTRPTAPTTATRPAWSASGRCKYLQQKASPNSTRTRLQGRQRRLVRADDLPLVLPVLGAQGLPRGARVRVKLGDIDEITLDVHGTVVERLDAADAADARPDEDGRRRRGTGGRPDRHRGRLSTDTAEAAATAPAIIRACREPARHLSTLQIALGVSVAVHAALLTVRFVDPEGFNRVFQDTPLEVILVNATTNEQPEKAQAIAQASLAGGGEADKGRATSPAAAVGAAPRSATPPKTRSARSRPCRTQQMLLLAQIKQAARRACRRPIPRNRPRPAEAAAREEKRRQLVKLLAEIERRINEENARPKKRYISPATREEVYASTTTRLRRRIEDRGTAELPRARRQEAVRRADHDRHRQLRRPRARHRGRRELGQPHARPPRPGHRAQHRPVRPLQRRDAPPGRPDRAWSRASSSRATRRWKRSSSATPEERADGPLLRDGQPGRAQPLAVDPRALRRTHRPDAATTARGWSPLGRLRRRRSRPSAPEGGRRGCNVTVPFKFEAAALADARCSAARALAGACNTLRFDGDDGIHRATTPTASGLVHDIERNAGVRAGRRATCCWWAPAAPRPACSARCWRPARAASWWPTARSQGDRAGAAPCGAGAAHGRRARGRMRCDAVPGSFRRGGQRHAPPAWRGARCRWRRACSSPARWPST